jgi:gentisate 1,2-dioxygenase
MKYAIDNTIVNSNIVLNSSNGYSRAIELNELQIAFYNANKDEVRQTQNREMLSSEVLAMELIPIPEPPEPSNEPTLKERVETNEDALDELIQYVYGGA